MRYEFVVFIGFHTIIYCWNVDVAWNFSFGSWALDDEEELISPMEQHDLSSSAEFRMPPL